MRSQFASLRVLVLPFGATTGQRIIIDGINGAITVYDNNNDRVLVIDATSGALIIGPDTGIPLSLEFAAGGNPAIFFDGDSNQTFGTIQQFGFGAYGNSALVFKTPQSASAVDNRGTLIIASEVGANPVTFRFRDENAGAAFDIVQIDGGTVPDIMFLGNSLPRGLIRQIAIRTNDTAKNASAVSDMVINNVPVVAGRQYAIHLHCQIDMGSDTAGVGVWSVDFRINGTKQERFAIIEETGALRKNIDSTVYWVPSVTQATDDFDVYLTEITDGATVQMVGLSGTPNVTRTLTVTDLGI